MVYFVNTQPQHHNKQSNCSDRQKRRYFAPHLVLYGSIEQVTAGMLKGKILIDSIISTPPSDRAIKEHFAGVDTSSILAKLAAIQIQTWNYKHQSPAVRHIGPMAQDFYAAFNVGEDDKHINVVDSAGVAFAAIQALNSLVQAQAAELKKLQAEVDELKRQVQTSTPPVQFARNN
jgi:hypothetical protein